MKKYLVGIALALITTGAMAVDGYKGVKFGSSYSTLKKANLCSFKPYSSPVDIKGFSAYECSDFIFSGRKNNAAVSFIDNKFQQLIINFDGETMPLLEALRDKYGVPSSSTPTDVMKRAAQTGEPVIIKFDHDTVIVRYENSNGKDKTTLIYAASDYEKRVNSLLKKSVSDDI
ncbi:hypothetical protein RG484_001618 [Morganella morganii]|nr:hypothetical protein [Morganella morganii]HAE76502.1 hypothetical protein [Morganella sp. (in: enterobacteria)]HDU8718182.1 hypothetical protein [Morganella morganii subsp. morganii]